MAHPTSSGRSLAGNTIIATTLHVTSALIVLCITPYALHRLGLELYGLWALLNTLTRYSLVADFGLGPSVTRHVAQYAVRAQKTTVRAITTIGTVYYLVIALLLFVIAHVAAPAAFMHLSLSPDLRPIAPGLFLALLGAALCNMVCWMSPSATLCGLGTYRYVSAINALAVFVYTITAAALLTLGWGVTSLVIAAYMQSLVAAVIGFVTLSRVSGDGVYTLPWKIPPRLFREILAFGGWLQIGTLANLAIYDAPPLIIGSELGVAAVGIFDVGSRLARALRVLSYNFNSALLPTFSSRHEEGGGEHLLSLLPQAMRIMATISCVAMGLLIALAPIILHIWLGRHAFTLSVSVPVLGHEYLIPLIEIVLTASALTYTLDTLVSIAATAVRGLGKPWLEACNSVTYAILSIALSLLFTPYLGLSGTVLAIFLASMSGATLFTVISAKQGGFSLRHIFGNWFRPLISSTILTIFVVGIAARQSFLVHGSVHVLLAAALIGGVIYMVLFTTLLRVQRFFSEADFQAILTLTPARLGTFLTSPIIRKIFLPS